MSTPPLPQDVLDAFHATTGFMPDDEGQAPVSYTHLTLPTICSV